MVPSSILERFALRQPDPWKATLLEIVRGKTEIETPEILSALAARGEDVSADRPADHSRITKILAGLGWQKRQLQRDGERYRAFVSERQ